MAVLSELFRWTGVWVLVDPSTERRDPKLHCWMPDGHGGRRDLDPLLARAATVLRGNVLPQLEQSTILFTKQSTMSGLCMHDTDSHTCAIYLHVASFLVVGGGWGGGGVI